MPKEIEISDDIKRAKEENNYLSYHLKHRWHQLDPFKDYAGDLLKTLDRLRKTYAKQK